MTKSEPIFDVVVGNCLDISQEQLQSIKSKISLSSLQVLESIEENYSTDSMAYVGFRLVFEHIYWVVIYAVLSQKLDDDIKSLKNRKKIPQLEKAFENQLVEKSREIRTAVWFEYGLVHFPRI